MSPSNFFSLVVVYFPIPQDIEKQFYVTLRWNKNENGNVPVYRKVRPWPDVTLDLWSVTGSKNDCAAANNIATSLCVFVF